MAHEIQIFVSSPSEFTDFTDAVASPSDAQEL
jgi:hypothetical protein